MLKTEVHKPEVEMKASKAAGGVSVVESASTLGSLVRTSLPHYAPPLVMLLCHPAQNVMLFPQPAWPDVTPSSGLATLCHYQP